MGEKTKKKIHSHFYEIYVQKVLKQVSPNSGISSDAKQQFNYFLCVLSDHISQLAIDLTLYSKKKTISEKEIYNALTFTFTDEILTNSVSEGDRAVTIFKDNNQADNQSSFTSRQKKASIIFPPFLAEKFIRKFGNSKLCVKSTAPVFLAASLEYITADILSSASIVCMEDKRSRISIRDIELTIRNDSELGKVMKKINFAFLGGGVDSFICPILVQKSINKNNGRKKRTINSSLKKIKNEQKNDNLILSKSGFEIIVRNFFKSITEENTKISSDVFLILQHFIEQYIINLLHDSNFIAIHSNRTKVNSSDIALASYIKGETRNPYNMGPIESETDIMDENVIHHGTFSYLI